MQTKNDENYEITGEEFKKKMSEVIKNPPQLSSLKQQPLIPLFCIECNNDNDRVKQGSYIFMNPIGSNIKIASYNKDCSYLVQNPTDRRYYSDDEATKLIYDAFLRNQQAQANTISLLNQLKIEKYTAKPLEKRLWFKIPCFSEETNLISCQADDDIAISPIHKGANIVFCHVRDKDIQDKERFFHGIPVKLFKGKNANDTDDHLFCNDDGTPNILFLSRKGIKFLSHNLDNAVLSLESANEFSFTSNDNISFNIKYEKEKNGQYQYFYQQKQGDKQGPWTKFDMKTAFQIPPLEQDVMWQKMIKKYPIMEEYKSKIFPKIEKIVKDKESDKKKMKDIEEDINSKTTWLDRVKNVPNNPSIQAYTDAIKQYKKNLAILKSKKYPSTDGLVKEFAENTNNPTLYWKAVTNKRRKRNKKVDYHKCVGERGWNKSTNTKNNIKTNTKNNINLTDITKNKELKKNPKSLKR